MQQEMSLLRVIDVQKAPNGQALHTVEVVVQLALEPRLQTWKLTTHVVTVS